MIPARQADRNGHISVEKKEFGDIPTIRTLHHNVCEGRGAL